MNGGVSRQSNEVMSLLGGVGSSQSSGGFSEQMEFEVDAREFTTLRSGGPLNKWEVDAIVFQGGRRFAANGKTWLPVTFPQIV